MPMKLAEMEAILKEEGLKYSTAEDYLRISFSTDSYRDSEGEASIYLILKLEEGGEYFKLIAPNLYSCRNEENRAAAFQTLLMVSWKTKLVQFEFDDNDGEIRAIVEFPIEDGVLTRKQVLRCMNGMVQIIDDYHSAIMSALRNGSIEFGADGKPDELGKQAEEIYAYLGKKPAASRDRLELEE